MKIAVIKYVGLICRMSCIFFITSIVYSFLRKSKLAFCMNLFHYTRADVNILTKSLKKQHMEILRRITTLPVVFAHCHSKALRHTAHQQNAQRQY